MPRKRWREESTYDAAIARFRTLYDRFDRVVVGFSGGKDSTVCLQLALEVARERDRLPVEAVFWDEEAVHPETIEYVERVAARDDVDLLWLCLPIAHRNACSRRVPYWFPWDPAARDRWVRELPARAVTSLDGFEHGMSMPEAAHLPHYNPSRGIVADVRGLRADESLRRYQAVTKKFHDNWIGEPRYGYSVPVSPIYDWTTVDVWTAPRMFGWDYNHAYDVMGAAGIPVSRQRVCPPFGEEPLGALWMYAVCWPHLWDRMIERVPGAATAARYAKTELYGYGRIELPPGRTWRSWAFALVLQYDEPYRSRISQSVARVMRMHKRKTRRPIPAEKPDPLTGVSWQQIANIVARGDMKGRRAGLLADKAVKERERLGISMEEALDDDGTRY